MEEVKLCGVRFKHNCDCSSVQSQFSSQRELKKSCIQDKFII